jgi:CheY-like chemotaxis protein
VAEDNPVNQKVALRILEKLGYRADAVANGKEAVAALEAMPYDLVFMDVQMPEMNGFEATRVIRDPATQVPRHDIPIIAMTAHAMKGDREKCLAAGMDDYISKPVTALALQEILDKYHAEEVEEEVPPKASDPVELGRIRDLAEGDKAFERELIEAFIDDAMQRLSSIQKAVKEEDREQLTREAHSLKGSSANSGAVGMQQIVSRLEQIGASGEFSDAQETLAYLETEFEKVRGFLVHFLEAIQDA